ncbi:MAG: glutamine--tRNA ligase [Verrucomicrobiae bacterium]|nr:glutamine--tRNA ligase [Verrucomicrobiae bacterium]
MSDAPLPSHDFIREIVAADVAAGRRDGRVHTRFPPEPNGRLHIGHAKSICLNFGIAREFGGTCNLRMDDTNPTKEDMEHVDSIVEDVRWLIAGWAEDRLGLKLKGASPRAEGADFHLPAVGLRTLGVEPFFASDYFDALYELAVRLIRKGKAYVCDHTPEEVDRMRGAPGRAGEPSAHRDRSVAENLDLFAQMKAGRFPDGSRTLRAKIDMASPNVWLRDPVLYRIRHANHHQTGDRWRIYPMYDFAHGLSDYIEGITHSLCTLEFEVHRPLYDWILENLDLPRPLPRQREFARLNLTWTVMSKRKLLRLVEEKHVAGWDDPRMPTLAGLRNRGYPAAAVRAFCERIGVAKRENTIELGLLEHFVREELNRAALRRFAVLRPLKVVLVNLPEGHAEELSATNNPEDPSAGARRVSFGRELWIERDDFAENPPPKFFRLKPGGEVRLKNAYVIRCEEVVKDARGNPVELRCTADLTSKTGGATSNRKVKGTIHWVSAACALEAEVRLLETLFTVPAPDAVEDFTSVLNPRSLEVLSGCKLEPLLAEIAPGVPVQFERLGYFVRPQLQGKAEGEGGARAELVFLRTVTLKDARAKLAPGGASG